MTARRAAAALAVLAAGLMACTGSGHPAANTTPGDRAGTPPPLHGVQSTGALSQQQRPEFTLVDTSGRRYDFRARTKGQVTLLYFGYTHCPDECPTSMADVAAALRSVPADVSRQVQVVFATTDPWRDNAKVLRAWLDRFHPPQPYVGLTGSPTEIVGAETTMGMPISSRESAPPGGKAGQYAVSHFAGVLVYGRDDRLVTLYPSGVQPADIAADLRVLVKE